MKLTQSVIVEAPATFCFDCLTRIEDAPKYMSIVKSIKMQTPGEVRLGTRWRETLEIFGKRVNLEASIVRFDRPQGYRLETAHRGLRMGMAFDLKAVSPRQTAVDLHLDAAAETMLGKIALAGAAPFATRIRSVANWELNTVKLAIEEEHKALEGAKRGVG